MRSAGMLEECRRGVAPFPVLRLTLVARGLSLGSYVYAPQGRSTAAGGVTGVTKLGGWDTIEYGAGVKDRGLRAVETAVSVVDPAGNLIRMLETYDPRGSVATIDAATPGLSLADWEPLFTGILSDWERDGGLCTKLILKTDDTALRTPVPNGVFTRTQWGSASEGTIYGTQLPLVLGFHCSFDVTMRGMVPAVNVRYDKDQGYWWLASVDRMIEITKLYFDGLPQGTGGWSLLRGVYGGHYLTLIVIAEGFQPEKGVVVSFDGSGPNEDGLATGEPLTGAVDQLRVIIEEYAYRSPPLAGWRGPHPIIDDTSWSAASLFFATHSIESARRFGGDQNAETVSEIIDGFLEAYQHVRIWWNELGKLEMFIIDPDDVDPDDDAHLDLAAHNVDGIVPFIVGDSREVYSQVRMPFMWSSAEQKFLSAYEAHDVAALPEKLVLTIDNPWSQCRFASPLLNPHPPGVSASASVSPSASESTSVSASYSPSASASESTSVSSSVSPSASVSPSNSNSPSASPSASA